MTRPKGWTVDSSTIQKNAGAGVMLGSGSRMTGNCLRDNGQYGFNAYHADGVRDVVLHGNEISGNNTDDWERPEAGMRLHRRRQVLGDKRRTDHRQLRPRQQRSRPMGGLQQRRLSLRGQLHLRQRRRGHHVRDELQRGDPGQHTRPERARQGSHQPGIPGVCDLSVGVGKRHQGRRAVRRGISSLGKRLRRQLVRHRGVGERGSIRRIPRQHQHRRRAHW